MSRKKVQETEIELGILQNYGDEDETITSEETSPEETFKTAEAVITRVGTNDIWVSVNDLGYIITVEELKPWMVKGATAYVIYEGTFGKADCKIAGVKE